MNILNILHFRIGANTFKIFNMRSYKEKRNFEVSERCAFFHFGEVLLSVVKKVFEFEIYLEGPISSSHWISHSNKKIHIEVLRDELSMYVTIFLYIEIFL